MNPWTVWLTHHPAILGAFALWIFSSLVSGMPAPRATSGIAYTWLYRSMQSFAGSLKQIKLLRAEFEHPDNVIEMPKRPDNH